MSANLKFVERLWRKLVCRRVVFVRAILSEKMTIAKRFLIETESREVFIVRMNGKSNIRGFCHECSADSEMLTVDEAVSISDLTTIKMLELLRLGRFHQLETASGHLLICRNSLETVVA